MSRHVGCEIDAGVDVVRFTQSRFVTSNVALDQAMISRIGEP